MPVDVYHVDSLTLGRETLKDALLVTLYDVETASPRGSLTGQRVNEGTADVLEFEGRCAGKPVRVRIDSITVTRAAGPGFEFVFLPGGLHVTERAGQTGEAK